MRNAKVIAVALALVLAASCKKKTQDTGTGSDKMGSGSSAMGSGSADTGSGSAAMGSGSADMGSGSGSAATEPPKPKEAKNWAPADMKWVPLDPSAADKSPMVVSLWGDMTKEPNGFLIKIKGGDKGTLHTHTGDYHAATVAGTPTNAQDGQKKAETLPVGSAWFQPGGLAHTTACPGKDDCVGFVHFNEGKFDFAPAEAKKDAKPDPKYVEKRAKDLKWKPLDPKAGAKGPQTAEVWGDSASGPNGFFIKVPAGFASPAHTHSADYHAVVLKGTMMNYAPDDKAPKEMPSGSYWFQPANGAHVTACKKGAECMAYVYMLGKFDFMPAGGDAGGAGSGSAAGGSAAGGSAAGGSAAAGSGSGK
jgi:uncharacterized protein DUF4437